MPKSYPKPKLTYFIFLLVLLPIRQLLAQPVISSFSPRTGSVGSTVTISGSNFSTVAADNIVHFGMGTATVTASSATTLIVKVPTGVSYAAISVTTGGLTGFSRLPFVVTFSGSGPSFAMDSFARSRFIADAATWDFSVADMDGDGKPDVMVSSGYLAAYKNYTTTPGSLVMGGAQNINVEIGSMGAPLLFDMDGDGKPDMLFGNYFYLNTSTTTISYTLKPNGNPINPENPIAQSYADLDGDGLTDMILTFADTTLAVFRNTSTTGNISFAAPQTYRVGTSNKQLAVGDVDGDGRPDIIVTTRSGGIVSIFTNTSTLGNISMVHAKDYVFPTLAPDKLATGDLDGDGKLDLAVTDWNQDRVIFFRNNGGPGSVSFTTDTNTICSYPHPEGIAIGDLDGDGKPDIAVTSDSGALNFNKTYPVTVFKNTSTPGSISVSPGAGFPAGYSSHNGVVTDMDGDGKADMLSVDPAGAQFVVLSNRGVRDTTADTVTAPPHILGFTPDSAASGAMVTITGAHFTGATAVNFGATPGSFTVVSDSLIRATVGSGSSGYVQVVTALGRDSAAGFVYLPPATPSHITGFNPTSAYRGETVQIFGHSFTGTTSISFGDSAAQRFTVTSDTLIYAVVGNGASGQIRINGASGLDSIAGFVYIPLPATPPHITSFTPTSAHTGDTVQIFGHSFTGTTSVSFAYSTPQWYAVINDSLIDAVVGSGSSGLIRIVSPMGYDSIAGFVYLPSPPNPLRITRFTPTSARTGDTVHIYGHSFTGTSYVTFGYTAAKRFDIINDTTINAVVGNGASGLIRINSPSGLDSIAGFIYIDTTASNPDTTSTDTTKNTPPPVPVSITRFSPTSAHTGDTVEIYGHSFTGTTFISFGFTAAQRYTVINDTTIDAVVGNGSSGLIRIAGPNGLDSIAGFIFIDSTTSPSSPDTTTHDTTVAVFRIAQFSASVIANQAVLQWKAMHEKGLSYYVIEHGADTSHLTAIGAVPALNEDSATYSFTDTASRNGINYYRLQAGEVTGDTVSSGIIAVQLAGAPATLTGYPNPAVNSILVALPSILKQSKFMLVDMNGNTLQTIVVGANIPQTQIDVSHLNPGIYKLVWSDGTNVSYQLVMIMK